MTKDVCLCLHGHFYQPPRENPWTEQIEIQGSAAPFHDWNERIYSECYLPNTIARVLDSKGQLVDIVNNFETISFNLGPSLCSWLKEKHPATLERIAEADAKSCALHHGHGNAIAQVYNHMILPLANRRDKVTQVKWGIEDFRHRFKRNPEAMWLPETACNEETLEVLAEEGMKYAILSPYQAEAIRPIKEEKWQDASDGRIDPKHPYRYFLKNKPEQFINVFFYDGPISRDIGFGNLLFEANLLMNRIEGAKVEAPGMQLIHVSTDGESFGHHKAFGERAIAYLLSVEAPKRNFRVVNYAEYLEMNPPEFAVRINFGEKGEGTAWSCAHGVKRWEDHCGCRGAGPAEWTQHWRKPLRDSLDWLRDELAKTFQNLGKTYLKDVWNARNDYIRVILDNSEESVARFFKEHAAKRLRHDEEVTCLKLLEMERHAMLMYTSCGWFFSELSGIETVQILQYAARAIELAEGLTGDSFEEEFLLQLSEAKSNIPQYKDGRGVWNRFVKPAVVKPVHVVSYYGIHSSLGTYTEKEFPLYGFKLKVLHQRMESNENVTLNWGRVHVVSQTTFEEHDFIFATLQQGNFDFQSSIRPFDKQEEFDQTEAKLFELIQAGKPNEAAGLIATVFGNTYYSLKDLLVEWKIQILSLLTKESIAKINETYDHLYEDHKMMNEIYHSLSLPIPEVIQYAVAHALRRRITAALVELAKDHFDPKKAGALYRLAETAEEFNVKVKKDEATAFLSEQLGEKAKELLTAVREEVVAECLNIQKIAKRIGITIKEGSAQDYVLCLLKRWREHPDQSAAVPSETIHLVHKFASNLQINPKK